MLNLLNNYFIFRDSFLFLFKSLKSENITNFSNNPILVELTKLNISNIVKLNVIKYYIVRTYKAIIFFCHILYIFF